MKVRITHALMIAMLSGTFICDQQAIAETTNCTPITSLPAIITTQGVYCFTHNLVTSVSSGNAIEIQTNNVTIDMNGFKLGGQAAGLGTTMNGIYAYQRKNIIIRNGTIRGFYRGIWLGDSSPYETSKGHLIEDVLLDANTYMGAWIEGRGMRFRNNHVVATGGSTASSYAYAVLVYGPSAAVINNEITAITSDTSYSSYGIFIHTADNDVVANNMVAEVTAPGASSYGILINTSNNVTVRDNTITTASYGIYFTSSAGKYMGNLTNDIATTAFTGGTPVGTND